MKVKCISNSRNSVPSDLLSNYSIGDVFSVKIGKEYVVYAAWTYLGYIWYCICDEDYTFYPFWTPSMLFEVTNDKISRYWVFGFREAYQNTEIKDVPLLSFPEWANSNDFYDELIEGEFYDPNAIIFKKYKELMDLEFPDPSIIARADIGDENWLICPGCIDAWESKESRDALVKCPKCQVIYNNPRYTNKWPHS